MLPLFVGAKMNQALPNLKKCKTRCITETLHECLVTNPSSCKYALPFGYNFFCTHPEAAKFVKPEKPISN